MPYGIRSVAQFGQNSQGRMNFSQLYQDQRWNASASRWGAAELYASRAILVPQRDEIGPLSGSYSDDDLENLNAHLTAFANGFPNRNDLTWTPEPQLLRRSKHDGFGYIWVVVGAFLRWDQFDIGVYSRPASGSSSRPTRLAAVTALQSIQSMSATRPRPQQGRVLRSTLLPSMSPSLSTTSGSSGSLLGYTESNLTPLLEDATVHLVGYIMKYLLNFKQAPSKENPLTWRNEKIRYSYSRGLNQPDVVAADDGGIQIWVPGSPNFRQVMLFEAKRALRNADGTFQVTDEVLAQMVAQAIAIQRASQTSTYIAVRPNLYVSRLSAVQHLTNFYRKPTYIYVTGLLRYSRRTDSCDSMRSISTPTISSNAKLGTWEQVGVTCAFTQRVGWMSRWTAIENNFFSI